MERDEDRSQRVVGKVTSGEVEGSLDGDIIRFLGIPYAEPLTADNRFKEPKARSSWNGVLDCTAPGPSAPYEIPLFPGLDISALVGPGGFRDPDFLRLNVWAPKSAKTAPVVIWIHGGAFVLGTKDASASDCTAFAQSGIVAVAINYRVGVDGFLPIPGIPTNLGLRDMLFAIAWVRDNIENFGGDPDNITLFGESAGAMAIADLVTSPLAKGLFKRVIIQSGHGAMVRDIGVAERVVQKLAKLLKISPDAKGFRDVPFERSWAAMQKLSKPFARLDLRDPDGLEPVFGISRFIPVIGDDVLPKAPLEALKDGAGKDVDVLIGTNAEEMNFYFVPTKVKSKLRPFLAKWLLGKSHPAARKVLKAYGMGQKGVRAGDAFTKAMTDLVFRWPSRRFAEEHRGRTHVYEFEWRSPRYAGDFGAAHGMELGFVFKTLPALSGHEGMLGESPPTELAERIHKIWVDFAKDGSLRWNAFDRAHRNVHLLAADRTIEEPAMPAAPFLP